MGIRDLLQEYLNGIDYESEIYDDKDFSVMLLVDSGSDETEEDRELNVQNTIVNLVKELDKISSEIKQNITQQFHDNTETEQIIRDRLKEKSGLDFIVRVNEEHFSFQFGIDLIFRKLSSCSDITKDNFETIFEHQTELILAAIERDLEKALEQIKERHNGNNSSWNSTRKGIR